MIFSRNLKEKLLPIIVSRIVIFFLLMSLLTLFLYAAGTGQGFTDTTQLALLKLYTVFGILLIVSSGYGIIVSIGRYIRFKRIKYFIATGTYLLFVILGGGTVVAALAIITLVSGNGG